MTCKPRVLVEGDNFYISQCRSCKRVGMYFNNLMMGFSKEEFINFAESMLSLEFKAGAIFFPDREPRIITQTCHPDINFVFKEDEFETIREAMAQAKMLIEAEEIIEEKWK